MPSPPASVTEPSRPDVLLVGRWHAVTRDRKPPSAALSMTPSCTADLRHHCCRAVRHPSSSADSRSAPDIVRELADALGLPFEIHSVVDIPDSDRWPQHVLDAIRPGTIAALGPKHTTVVTANPDVLRRFEALGFRTLPLAFEGPFPPTCSMQSRRVVTGRRSRRPGQPVSFANIALNPCCTISSPTCC
jgi:hypothetical protein